MAPARLLAFTHVTVIDTVRGTLKPDITVVIRGDRIIAVGKTGQIPIPKEAQVVDARGKFLIPGLWDMHFHTPDENRGAKYFSLSPLEALQTATLNPARYLNLSRSLGTVEQGKIADLVLLDGNPLATIGNTRKIAGVVVNGTYLPSESIQKMLAEVEAIAGKN